MKRLILSLFAIFAFANFSLAQSPKHSAKVESKKVIVMVNTTNWCPACKANGQRVEKDVISQYMSNGKYQIVVNDLSTDETKATSKAACKSAGIGNVAENNKSTGVIYFISSKTKDVVAQISVTESNDIIKKAFEEAVKKI